MAWKFFKIRTISRASVWRFRCTGPNFYLSIFKSLYCHFGPKWAVSVCIRWRSILDPEIKTQMFRLQAKMLNIFKIFLATASIIFENLFSPKFYCELYLVYFVSVVRQTVELQIVISLWCLWWTLKIVLCVHPICLKLRLGIGFTGMTYIRTVE